jgi:hypothetical protein
MSKNLLVTFFTCLISTIFFQCTNHTKSTDGLHPTVKNLVSEEPAERNKSLVAEVINMANHKILKKKFKIENDKEVRIFAVGELINTLVQDSMTNKIAFDRVELKFSNESGLHKRKTHNFIYSWGSPSVEGDNAYLKSMKYVIKDHSLGYRIEIKYPINELFDVKDVPKVVNFNFTAVNNNYYNLNYNTPNKKQPLKLSYKPSNKDNTYGKLIFESGNKRSMDRNGLVCKKTWRPIKIDGIDENKWKLADSIVLNKDSIGFKATLKTLYNDSYLYFYINVLDSLKQFYIPFADYGWIEDLNGKKVWLMSDINSHHAGGAAKNQITNNKLFLKKGTYFLCFKTDESHSYDTWNDDKPTTSFYGIKVWDILIDRLGKKKQKGSTVYEKY